MKVKTKESNKLKNKMPKEWPKVAIIILNWNGWKDTIECLESVFRNTYPNYQVIVIDNGSTNASMEKIKAWAEGKQEVLTPEPTHTLYYLSHPPVKKTIPYICYTREEAEKSGNFKLEEKVTKKLQEHRKANSKELNPTSAYPLIFIQTGENLGYAGGNNIGIKIAMKNNVEYVLILNNDVVVAPDSLDPLVFALNDNSEVGIVGGILLYYDNKNIIQNTGGYINFYTGQVYTKGNLNEISSVREDILIKRNVDFICGAAIMIKTDVFVECGLFDEDFFLYNEEAEFCFRIKKWGYKVLFIPTSKVWHKECISTKKIPKRTFFYQIRNKIWLVMRYANLKEKIVFIILQVIYFLPKIIIGRLLKKEIYLIKPLIKGYYCGFFKS